MELPAEVTPVTPEQVAAGFIEAAGRLSLDLNADLLATLLGHSALETGHWRALKAWAFGHVKHRPGASGDWMFIYATENLTDDQVSQAMAAAGPRTDGEGRDMQVVSPLADSRSYCKFWPSHPQACFRAFRTLSDGAEDYLAKLMGRYALALPMGRAGDVAGYVTEIHRRGYFTAHLHKYRRDVVRLAAQYLPIAKAAVDGYDPRMTERDPDPYELPDDIYDRDEALLRQVRADEHDEPEWQWVDVGGGLEVELMMDALKWDGVRYGVTPYTQQLILDELGAVALTPKLADIHAAQARNDGGLVGPFPRPITAATSGYEAHSADIDDALDEDHCGFVSSFKHWCLSLDLWAKRGMATNYGWHVVSGAAAPAPTIPSVSKAELTVIQGPYEAHGAGADTDGDGYADSGHTDYSQPVTGARDARLHGQAVELRDVYMGKLGGDVAALVSHEGALPGWRFPGVPADDGRDDSDSMPRITHPGEKGDEVHAWQLWLMANGYPLPRFGSDRDHGGETEGATIQAMADLGIARTPVTMPPAGPLAPIPEAKWMQARYFREGRPHGPARWIVIHTAEVAKHPRGAEGLGRYVMTMADGRSVSWHASMDNDSRVRSVGIGNIAYAAGPLNDRGIHYELSTRTHLTWDDEYTRAMLDIVAATAAEDAEEAEIPITKVDPNQLYAGVPGFIGHGDVSAACTIAKRNGAKIRPWWSPTRNRWRSTNHIDPGPRFPWAWFLQRVRAYS